MKEEEIRKRALFDRYLELSRQDADLYFADKRSFVDFDCLACGSMQLRDEFEKNGFQYVSCEQCGALFINPRPSFDALNNFYAVSSSTSFWINDFFMPVAETRREKIFKPRAEYVHEFLGLSTSEVIGDIGAGFGLFLEELKKLRSGARFVAIEPSLEQAEICRSKDLEIECCALEELQGYNETFDVLTAFELMEHLFDPGAFLGHVLSLLRPKGIFILTTLNVHGFDIQVLWEQSKSISPPHHLNFFNPEALTFLLEFHGFEILEISTPGKLDWDILDGMIANEGNTPGRFWELLSHTGNDSCKQELQDWISRNNFSSHMRAIARKK